MKLAVMSIMVITIIGILLIILPTLDYAVNPPYQTCAMPEYPQVNYYQIFTLSGVSLCMIGIASSVYLLLGRGGGKGV